MRTQRVLLALAAITGLAGCASMSESECRVADWGRVGYTDGARGDSEQGAGANDARGVEAQRDLAQRDVDRRQDHAKDRSDHQHREVVDLRAGGEVLRVAREGEALVAAAGLVDRCGQQRPATRVREHEVDASHQRGHLSVGGCRSRGGPRRPAR